MSQSEQQAPAKKPSLKKMIFLASLGLLIPIFLVSMAFLAVNSDAKNQENNNRQKLLSVLKRVKLQNNKRSRSVRYKPLQKLHLNIKLMISAQI